jgi:hypothetical protein
VTVSVSAEAKREQAATRQRRKRERDKAAASAQAPLLFERPDWRLFIDPGTLPQRAGCKPDEIRAIVLKELVDNALDAGASVKLTPISGGYRIEDDGPGIAPEQVPQLFVVNRPLLSSKLKRRVTRGMLGNGLRVVMGVVAAHDGEISVSSRGRRLTLDVDRANGNTVVLDDRPSTVVGGTTVELKFADRFFNAEDANPAQLAIHLAEHGSVYDGPSLPSWYSAEDLRILLAAVPETATVADFIRDVFAYESDDERGAWSLGVSDVERLHVQLLKQQAEEPDIEIGALGRGAFGGHYAVATGEAEIRGALIPYTVEVWASCEKAERHEDTVNHRRPIINRTTPFATLTYRPDSSGLSIDGCGLDVRVPAAKRAHYDIALSVIAPHLRLMNDGKTPFLGDFNESIAKALKEATTRAYRLMHRPAGQMTFVDAAYEVMEDAYLKASDNGTLPAKARQIMYAARGEILRLSGHDKLNDKRFTQELLPDFMAHHPELTKTWDLVYDARGHFVEPHTGESVPLGTLQVRQYLGDRPRFGPAVELTSDTRYPTHGPRNRFNTVLFVEKEGFDELFARVTLAERYDIAVMSTKGMSVVAARMLLDRLAADGVRVLVLHDFDVSGFSIFGTLGTDSRRYTFENEVEIVDIGLRLTDVQEMGLESEPVDVDIEARAVTLRAHGATWDEIDFLAERRVELNAMTSRQLVDFVERKLDEYGVVKVVPDVETLAKHARRLIEGRMHREAFAAIEDEVRAKAAAEPLPDNLDSRIRELLSEEPELSWDIALARIVNGEEDEDEDE